MCGGGGVPSIGPDVQRMCVEEAMAVAGDDVICYNLGQNLSAREGVFCGIIDRMIGK